MMDIQGISDDPSKIRHQRVSFATSYVLLITFLGGATMLTTAARFHLASWLVLFVLPISSSSALAQVTNGSFETPETTFQTGIGGVFGPNEFSPTTQGDWSGDRTSIVSTENGITPHTGSNMLRFINSEANASSLNGSEIVQILDLSLHAADIANGVGILDASAFFNRIVGDAQTDTGFGMSLHAFTGAMSTLPAQSSVFGGSGIGTSEDFFFSDSNLATWEELTLQLLLPATTDFAVVRLYAFEDVFNDSSGTEFDGHYLDSVSVNFSIVPEPSTALLMGIGLATLGALRRTA